MFLHKMLIVAAKRQLRTNNTQLRIFRMAIGNIQSWSVNENATPQELLEAQ